MKRRGVRDCGKHLKNRLKVKNRLKALKEHLRKTSDGVYKGMCEELGWRNLIGISMRLLFPVSVPAPI